MSNKIQFEDRLKQLQCIVEDLESETLSLDKMIKLFEDGMLLMNLCKKDLSEVEGRIKTLMKDGDKFIESAGIEKQ
jgi:exodeoxyribonuclease VII small subunit